MEVHIFVLSLEHTKTHTHTRTPLEMYVLTDCQGVYRFDMYSAVLTKMKVIGFTVPLCN